MTAANDVAVQRVGADLPPHDLEAERAVLACVLVDAAALDEMPTLAAEHFYSEAHRRIFEACRALRDEARTIDLVTVASWLRDRHRLAQVGGAGYLSETASADATIAHVHAYAERVLAKAAARSLSSELARLSAEVRAERIDPAHVLDRIERVAQRCAPSLDTRIVSLEVDKLFAALPPVPWLCEGLRIAPGRPSLFAGYGYSGKSLVAQSLALSVAAGRDVLGLFGARRGRVLHLDYEQGRRLTAERYQRLARAMGIGAAELEGHLRVSVYPQFLLSDPDAEEVLVRETEGHALAIVDSLTCAIPSIDEASREIAAPLYMLGRVSDRTGVTFLVLHHARKPSRDAAGGAAMAIRGSSAIFGAVDSAYVFSAPAGGSIDVEHVRSPTSGILVAPFALAIGDVEIDGRARAGLVVRHLDPAQRPSRATPTDKFGELKTAILDLVRSSPEPLSSANAICARVTGGGKDLKLQAIRELVAAGDLVQPGGDGGAYRAV